MTLDGRGTPALALLAMLFALLAPVPATAQTGQVSDADGASGSRPAGRVSSSIRFVGGALAALGAHEAGHLAFDYAFDAEPRIERVEFHGIPFFAIAHREGLSPRRELTISSAGFWVQHAGSEWILTRRPRLRSTRAPVLKGVLAFNVLASAAYAGTAFARTGPPERDTRGIAASADVDERWVGAIVLAPAVLDAWRYFAPDARWATWSSRAAKVGMLLLLCRSSDRVRDGRRPPSDR